MSDPNQLHLLLVEDSPSDALLVREYLVDPADGGIVLDHVTSLAEAITRLKEKPYDAVLLDLSLPDSQGLETFKALYRQAESIPIIVFTGGEDGTGLQAMQVGAEDLLLKNQAQAAVIRNAVRFAVLRSVARRTREEEHRRLEQERELGYVDRMVSPLLTSITARMYSGRPLKEVAPEEFQAAVDEYEELLGVSLEQRILEADNECHERLRELALQLGFLRGSPRDVVEIHLAAMRQRMAGALPAKAQAFVEEGRVLLLELMGNLASYYRTFHTDHKSRTPSGK